MMKSGSSLQKRNRAAMSKQSCRGDLRPSTKRYSYRKRKQSLVPKYVLLSLQLSLV